MAGWAVCSVSANVVFLLFLKTRIGSSAPKQTCSHPEVPLYSIVELVVAVQAGTAAATAH